MARNVHTMDGTPPETTGPRGVRISHAQARVLRIARASGLRKFNEFVGAIPQSFQERGAWLGFDDSIYEPVLVSGATVDSLIARGLAERLDDCVAVVTAAGRAALEAGNIG